MFGRRKHQWKVVDQHYNPPPRGGLEAERITEDVILRLTYGMTVTTLECQLTGDRKFVTTPGRAQ